MKYFAAVTLALALALSPAEAATRTFCRDSVFPAIMSAADGFESCMFREIGNRVRAQCATGFCDPLSDLACMRRVQIRVDRLAPNFCAPFSTQDPTPTADMETPPVETPVVPSPTPTGPTEPLATRGDCRRGVNPAVLALRGNFGTCNLGTVRTRARILCGGGLCDRNTVAECTAKLGRRVNTLLTRICDPL